jgi:hypothetical protein
LITRRVPANLDPLGNPFEQFASSTESRRAVLATRTDRQLVEAADVVNNLLVNRGNAA